MAKKNVEANYSVEVAYCSRELTAKERVMVKDTTDAMKLDRVTAEDAIVIKPDWYATLKIHNEKADDVDYDNTDDLCVPSCNGVVDTLIQFSFCIP